MSQSFDFKHFSLRFGFALLLVCVTFNSTGYSLFHWLMAIFPSINPGFLLCTIIALIGWAIFIRATLRSLGKIGLTLITLFVGTLVWFFVDLGWMSLNNLTLVSWIANIAIAIVLALGMSWSHIRRRMTGQIDVDDVDN